MDFSDYRSENPIYSKITQSPPKKPIRTDWIVQIDCKKTFKLKFFFDFSLANPIKNREFIRISPIDYNLNRK